MTAAMTAPATLPRRDMTDCPPAALRPLFLITLTLNILSGIVLRRYREVYQ